MVYNSSRRENTWN